MESAEQRDGHYFTEISRFISKAFGRGGKEEDEVASSSKLLLRFRLACALLDPARTPHHTCGEREREIADNGSHRFRVLRGSTRTRTRLGVRKRTISKLAEYKSMAREFMTVSISIDVQLLISFVTITLVIVCCWTTTTTTTAGLPFV